MSYYTTKVIKTDFESAIEKVTETLKSEGFGIISTIPIHEKLNEKLGVDFKKYIVLGACNPEFAYKALQIEDKIGVMLPCNVIVQEQSAGEVEVSAINPMESMQAVNNANLEDIAGEITARLIRAINHLE